MENLRVKRQGLELRAEPGNIFAFSGGQEVEHLRQHAGHDGEARAQPGGGGGRADRTALNGETDDRESAASYAAQVNVQLPEVTFRKLYSSDLWLWNGLC